MRLTYPKILPIRRLHVSVTSTAVQIPALATKWVALAPPRHRLQLRYEAALSTALRGFKSGVV